MSEDPAVRRLQLSPSILSADFARLGEQIRSVTAYVDAFHLDVMDGHYVANLTFGPAVVEAVRASCDLPLHVHLMISDPGRYARRFVEAGADRISFHPEVVPEPGEVIALIRESGAGAGLAVHPDEDLGIVAHHLNVLDVVLMMTVRPGFGGQGFLPEVLPKIVCAREMIQEQGLSTDVEVDGGVKVATLDAAVDAGGNILVSGSGIYDGVDPPAAARRLRERLDQLERAGVA
ncbi:MAG: ribulose-phosphate 3-epimerase [Actinomycetota bacterium]|nr:ribulose-phosphate 3-epimerase [Actinomycetota bacterium]